MTRKITPVVAVLLCLMLDTVFFPLINVLGMRPDALLAATVSYAILSGSLPGAIFGAVGGLLMEVFTAPSVGFGTALYLACGLCAGYFYQKFYADNVIVPALAALTAGFVKETVYMVALLLTGASFSVGRLLLQYILPSALLSALLCVLMHLAFKPLVARQISRQHAEHLGH